MKFTLTVTLLAALLVLLFFKAGDIHRWAIGAQVKTPTEKVTIKKPSLLDAQTLLLE